MFTVRFKVPGGEVKFTDMIRGEMSFDSDLIGDFIIVKSDTYPTYNFASPVDDATMKITHVIRGEEHLSNTPYQLMLIDALGYARPEAYAHMPLILAQGRQQAVQAQASRAQPHALSRAGLPAGGADQLPGAARLEPRHRAGDLHVRRAGRGASRSTACSTAARASTGRSSTGSTASTSARSTTTSSPRRLKTFLPRARRGHDQARGARAEDAAAQARRGGPTARLPVDRPAAARARRRRPRSACGAAIARCKDVAWEPAPIHDALMKVVESRGSARTRPSCRSGIAVTGKKISPPIDYTLALLPKDVALSRLARAIRVSD